VHEFGYLKGIYYDAQSDEYKVSTLSWFTPRATVSHCDFCCSSVLISCKFVVCIYHEVGIRNAY